MRVLVIGAGIIGVTTAFELRGRGFEVTVLERRPGVAQEASYANAGVLSAAYAGPWAQPGMPLKVLRSLWRDASPVILRPGIDPAQWRWIARWLGECRLQRFIVNKQRMQRLAEYSRAVLHEWRSRHGLDYEQSRGWLQLFRTDADLERARPSIEVLSQAGTAHRLLDAAGCRALEPALIDATPLAGGLHLPDEETGNCAYFARLIKDLAAAAGVEFRFETPVKALAIDGGRFRAAGTPTGAVAGDAVVVAAGADSGRLLRGTGARLPLYPVKGYSLTARITRDEFAPLVSVMDEAYKVAITRMGNRLRIAGTAELGNRRLELRDAALGTLLRVARDWFPGAAAYSQSRAWVGARPMLPDGPPVLGATAVPNVYLNLGHGSTGWSMACGSARVVADLVAGSAPQIDLDGLTIERFGRRRPS
jgi:D-amino-acid dehydrogenase